MKLPPSHQDSPRHSDWLARVNQLESEGLDTSDAQGIADMEMTEKETIKKSSTLDLFSFGNASVPV